MRFAGMVVHYNQRWVRRLVHAAAICFGHHVFTDSPSLSEHTLAHEYCHVAQYEVYGFFGYLVRWFYWTWKVGYFANPFEQQARTYADAVCPFLMDWYSVREIGPVDWVDNPAWSEQQENLWPY